MTIKSKNILFSTSALIMLITSVIIFHGYKSINSRFFQTVSTLERVNHSIHEMVIELLLNLDDVDSLKKHLKYIPIITKQLREISANTNESVELVDVELSILRIKRVIDHLISGKPISSPLLMQIRNEVAKINYNVVRLKRVSMKEMRALREKSEIKIAVLLALFATYIVGGSIIWFKMVIKPILLFSDQVEAVRKGELSSVTSSARKDEIGLLGEEFNQLLYQRSKYEEELKREVSQHKEALEKVKVLSGFIPICASCKQIRDDRGYWNQIETYIRDNSDIEFSHGICPECADRLYPGLLSKGKQESISQDKKSTQP